MSSGCNCGSSCSCGSDCGCGNMYPDVEKSTTVTIIEGIAPKKMQSDGSEKSSSAEGGHACNCGSNCTSADAESAPMPLAIPCLVRLHGGGSAAHHEHRAEGRVSIDQ
ncbi:metallothionein 1 [Olea europaea subsp. europaea]|uniref:Metallothionein-like protein n=1 Tax=Olea europaea subsp. europaea TaxID=158383 RepID=A0A8S0R8M0_OLEEU|nr:metallothionein 1 [Olea europaea subsp. europaea]